MTNKIKGPYGDYSGQTDITLISMVDQIPDKPIKLVLDLDDVTNSYTTQVQHHIYLYLMERDGLTQEQALAKVDRTKWRFHLDLETMGISQDEFIAINRKHSIPSKTVMSRSFLAALYELHPNLSPYVDIKIVTHRGWYAGADLDILDCLSSIRDLIDGSLISSIHVLHPTVSKANHLYDLYGKTWVPTMLMEDSPRTILEFSEKYGMALPSCKERDPSKANDVEHCIRTSFHVATPTHSWTINGLRESEVLTKVREHCGSRFFSVRSHQETTTIFRSLISDCVRIKNYRTTKGKAE